MNTSVMEYPDTAHPAAAGEMRVLWIAYLLHVFLVTAPLGLIINLYKLRAYRRRADVNELGLLRQHHLWLLRTLVVTALLVPVAIGTSYYYWGFVIGVAGAGWWLYRLGRGMRALSRHQSVPASV